MANIPEFNSTPWALPVGCYSIIVRHDAILTTFPGGVRTFERDYMPTRKSWVLYLLTVLIREAVDRLLARLTEDGLRPGVDVALADKLRRPVLQCPGVLFTEEPGSAPTGWRVSLGNEAPQVAIADLSAMSSPAPSDSAAACPSGALVPFDLVTIHSREAHGAIDTWTEYLCATRTEEGILLGIYAHQWLGEVPNDWYDDDGELLPEHQDKDGDLKLPDELDGSPVTGCLDDGFVGELQSTGWDPIELDVVTQATVHAAITDLGWTITAVPMVQSALRCLTVRP